MSYTMRGVIKADSKASLPRTRNRGRLRKAFPKVKPPVKNVKRMSHRPMTYVGLVIQKSRTFSVIVQLYGAAIAEWLIRRLTMIRPKPVMNITT